MTAMGSDEFFVPESVTGDVMGDVCCDQAGDTKKHKTKALEYLAIMIFS
jgi:hypothetical protein